MIEAIIICRMFDMHAEPAACLRALLKAGCKPSSSGSAAPASSLAVRAASAITQGRLLPNKEGVVDLPQNLQPVSSNQKAYVKHEANGTMWVLLLESMDNPNNFK